MTGKEKCAMLKSIRREIARVNQIPYVSEEADVCDYQGDNCTGTCPRCESQIRYLERELCRRAEAGLPVTVGGVDVGKVPVQKKRPDFLVKLTGDTDEKNPETAWADRVPIRALEVSFWIRRKLTRKGGFRTVGQLQNYTFSELSEKCGLGYDRTVAVRDAMEKMGLSLKKRRQTIPDGVVGMMRSPWDQ